MSSDLTTEVVTNSCLASDQRSSGNHLFNITCDKNFVTKTIKDLYSYKDTLFLAHGTNEKKLFAVALTFKWPFIICTSTIKPKSISSPNITCT